MRIVVLGGAGMLGQALAPVLSGRGHDVVGATRSDVDVRDPGGCAAAVRAADVVVNLAAWTKVDDAEAQEREAFDVNATGAAHVARACATAGARLVHLSTDYVFDGTATAPYGEDDPLRPRTAYGRTKAAGEWAVRAALPDAVIVRTAWLYGPGGPNFVRTMARLAGERETLSVVDDQFGQPTATPDVARFLADLVAHRSATGTFHATSDGETTWFGLARAVFEELGLNPDRVQPTTSDAYAAAAPRPPYSVLGHERTAALGLAGLPHWRDALAGCVHEVVAGVPTGGR